MINQSPSFPLTSQPTFDAANPGFQHEVINGFQSLAATGAAPYGDDSSSRLVPAPLPVIPLLGQFDPADPAAVLAGVDRVTFNGVIRPSFAALQEIAGTEADVNGDRRILQLQRRGKRESLLRCGESTGRGCPERLVRPQL